MANPKLRPSFVWATYQGVRGEWGAAVTADPAEGHPRVLPCAGTPRALWGGEEHWRAGAGIRSRFPAGTAASRRVRATRSGERRLFCSVPAVHGRSLEQEGTRLLFRTARLYPAVSVGGVTLFLIQKQQLALECVWHEGETLRVAPPPVPPPSLGPPRDTLPRSARTREFRCSHGSYTLGHLRRYNFDVRFRTHELNIKTVLHYCYSYFQIGSPFFFLSLCSWINLGVPFWNKTIENGRCPSRK